MGDPLGDSSKVLHESALSGAPLARTDDVELGPTTQGRTSSAPPPQGATSIYDESADIWRTPPPGNYSPLATYGEQNMAFAGYRLSAGWVLVDGPSGAGGHPYNSPGFDGVAFRYTNGQIEVRIVDNKALASQVVRSATALTKNLATNLTELEKHVWSPKFNGLGGIDDLRAAVADARTSVAHGLSLPSNVTLEVTNFGGSSVDVSPTLKNQGIRIRNLMSLAQERIDAEVPEAIREAPRAVRLPPSIEPKPTSTPAFRSALSRIAPQLRGLGGTMGQMVAMWAVQHFVFEPQNQKMLDSQVQKKLDADAGAIAAAVAAERLKRPSPTDVYVNVTMEIQALELWDPGTGMWTGSPQLEKLHWSISGNAVESAETLWPKFGFGYRIIARRCTFSWRFPPEGE